MPSAWLVLRVHRGTAATSCCRWLGTGRMEDLSKFQQARSTAKRAIRKAKNDWFQGDREREVWGEEGVEGHQGDAAWTQGVIYSHVGRQSLMMRRVSHAAAKKPSNSSGGGTLPRCSTSGASLRRRCWSQCDRGR